jgi:hypothetical protein
MAGKKKKQSGGRKIATDALPYPFFVRSFVRSGGCVECAGRFRCALYVRGNKQSRSKPIDPIIANPSLTGVSIINQREKKRQGTEGQGRAREFTDG